MQNQKSRRETKNGWLAEKGSGGQKKGRQKLKKPTGGWEAKNMGRQKQGGS